MRNTKAYVLIGGLVVGMVLAGAVMRSDSYAQNRAKSFPTTRVGVCNLVEVFNNYTRAKDASAKFEKQKNEIKAENDKRVKAIEAAELELEGLRPGSKDYRERYNKVQRLKIEHEAWLTYKEMVGRAQHLQVTKEMYNDILKMIGTVAKARNVDVVLTRQQRDLPSNTHAEFLAQMRQNNVLYNSDRVDITEAVLGQLNRSYRSKKP